MGALISLSFCFFPPPIFWLYFILFFLNLWPPPLITFILFCRLFITWFFPISSLSHSSFLPPFLISAAQKGLLHLSPDIYQEMEASRKQGANAPISGASSGSSVNYLPPKDMGPCSAPLPPGHPPYYSGSASSASPTAAMAKELLLNGQSAPIDTSLALKGTNPGLACGVSVQPAQQLDYLARIQGFQVRAKTELMLSEL